MTTTLSNWSIIRRGDNFALTGEVSGDDRWEDGTVIIEGIDRGRSSTDAYTQNSSYSLLHPDEEWFERAGGTSTKFWTKIRELLGKKFNGIQKFKDGGSEYF
jgi:hypothetical protein